MIEETMRPITIAIGIFMIHNVFMSLTKSDLKAIQELFELVLEQKGVVTQDDIKHLPSKDELYEQTAEILKRLDDLEISNELLASRVSNHSDVIDKLRKIHPSYKHA